MKLFRISFFLDNLEVEVFDIVSETENTLTFEDPYEMSTLTKDSINNGISDRFGHYYYTGAESDVNKFVLQVIDAGINENLETISKANQRISQLEVLKKKYEVN